jgi:hypothetical protein
MERGRRDLGELDLCSDGLRLAGLECLEFGLDAVVGEKDSHTLSVEIG